MLAGYSSLLTIEETRVKINTAHSLKACGDTNNGGKCEPGL